jgi:hypothetical protein
MAEGLVLDAEHPLCQRRFQLSPKSSALGLSNVEKTLLPASSYPGLMREVLPVVGGDELPLSKADQSQIEKIIDQHVKNDDLRIYAASFDADNAGKVRDGFIIDITLCNDKDSYWDSSVTTAIKNSDGTLDRSWGVYGATAGIPFIYNSHTYYTKWKSLRGSVAKNMLAELDVFDSVPYSGELRKINPYSVLTPSYCIIYQSK